MRTIHKAILDIREGNLVKVPLPTNAKPLSVAFQGESLVMWYWFNDKHYKGHTDYLFYVVRTGEEFPEAMDPECYIGTAQDGDGQFRFVLHVFSFFKM